MHVSSIAAAAAGRIRRWPSTTPVSLHAWMCDCGEYGVTDRQPDSQRTLQEHLGDAGHPGGEYYYGCQGQRTAVRVTAGADGTFSSALTDR
ncbi:MAG: hypothetical protein QOI50_4650 [Pseudonocardiales bacterium]|jgi:hypothetical protein|nr:hypothetical protein [Pseudonocardiales bacterium]MDT7588966.1 hypothetical protein [Pseudonocardiales bacterium]MDT7632720.1 hypothetical protein [Pseudonocardiales bacterium]MDT7774212.1 hypothetical protein [Pseudonocardiales bacterium]